MSKTRKINKDFILSDSSVNVYGFRLLTEGYVLEEYLKNPIGYYNHIPDDGILVTWTDIRIEGDNIVAKPIVNLSHPRGERTAQEIEDGVLKAASVGDIVLLEYIIEVDPETGVETVVGTKWYNKECSVVEKPGNRNAFTLLDATDKPLNLSDLKSHNKTNQMKKITLDITPELITVLGLSDSADAAAVTKGIKNLHDKNTQLEADNGQLKTAKEKAEQDLLTAQAGAKTEKVQNLLDAALTGKKITKELSDQFAEDYKGNPDGLEKVLKGMQAYQPITPNLVDGKKPGGELPEKFKGKTYDELFEAEGGLLQNLRDNHPDHFKSIYKEKFGKEPKERNS